MTPCTCILASRNWFVLGLWKIDLTVRCVWTWCLTSYWLFCKNISISWDQIFDFLSPKFFWMEIRGNAWKPSWQIYLGIRSNRLFVWTSVSRQSYVARSQFGRTVNISKPIFTVVTRWCDAAKLHHAADLSTNGLFEATPK